MNGAITPHTPIAVDIWTREAAAHCRLFFLTHAHTDHTAGLTKSWKKHNIYCSEVTKDIVAHKFGLSNDLLVGLPMDQAVTIPLDDYGQEKMTVTLIDANHCPGAVMFLFQGYFGCILHTGDFRYCKAIGEHPSLKSVEVDQLFLDNTYCHPDLTFPPRSQACQKAVGIVQEYLIKGFDIVIGMNALGKEDLLIEIAKTCQTYIGVDRKRLDLLKVLGLPDVFTDDLESTPVRVVMQREVTKAKLEEWNSSHPTIAILPTSRFVADINPYRYMSNIFVVPVSDHSSYTELEHFVSEIKPKSITPIVKKHKNSTGDEINSRANMNVFSKYLSKEPLLPIVIPETVLESMSCNISVKRRRAKQPPRYSYHTYKRRKCSGVVFPDELTDNEEKRSANDVELSKVNNQNCCSQELSKSKPLNTRPSSRTCVSDNEEERRASKVKLLKVDKSACCLAESSGSKSMDNQVHKRTCYSDSEEGKDVDVAIPKVNKSCCRLQESSSPEFLNTKQHSEAKPSMKAPKKKLCSLEFVTSDCSTRKSSSKDKTAQINSLPKSARNEKSKIISRGTKYSKCITDFYTSKMNSKNVTCSPGLQDSTSTKADDVPYNNSSSMKSRHFKSKTDSISKADEGMISSHNCSSSCGSPGKFESSPKNSNEKAEVSPTKQSLKSPSLQSKTKTDDSLRSMSDSDIPTSPIKPKKILKYSVKKRVHRAVLNQKEQSQRSTTINTEIQCSATHDSNSDSFDSMQLSIEHQNKSRKLSKVNKSSVVLTRRQRSKESESADHFVSDNSLSDLSNHGWMSEPVRSKTLTKYVGKKKKVKNLTTRQKLSPDSQSSNLDTTHPNSHVNINEAVSEPFMGENCSTNISPYTAQQNKIRASIEKVILWNKKNDRNEPCETTISQEQNQPQDSHENTPEIKTSESNTMRESGEFINTAKSSILKNSEQGSLKSDNRKKQYSNKYRTAKCISEHPKAASEQLASQKQRKVSFSESTPGLSVSKRLKKEKNLESAKNCDLVENGEVIDGGVNEDKVEKDSSEEFCWFTAERLKCRT